LGWGASDVLLKSSTDGFGYHDSSSSASKPAPGSQINLNASKPEPPVAFTVSPKRVAKNMRCPTFLALSSYLGEESQVFCHPLALPRRGLCNQKGSTQYPSAWGFGCRLPKKPSIYILRGAFDGLSKDRGMHELSLPPDLYTGHGELGAEEGLGP